MSDTKRTLLRHALATLAYRGGKAIIDEPEGFANFQTGAGTRTPQEILAHISDVLDWGFGFVSGAGGWNPSESESWDQSVERFFVSIEQLDAFFASDQPLKVSEERIFQGPIADALTHVGQLAMLRRLAGAPIRGENYVRAEIEIGRVGKDQSDNRLEFD